MGTAGCSAGSPQRIPTSFVPRRTFNRLQFGDRATINRGGSGLRIVSTEEGPRDLTDDWQIDIRAKDLREQFPDRNVPEP
ncbi:hypothetical protein [Halalkaliarchaeum desulfuricum]|uniref:hypothetical protein n=1 Tax=Halalkaliarchaeum desulfuricum TaxID=2055893 RepID=UPI00105AB0CB|nr:hypothetical protein [Halalkaliarchaeum desulfuricum]